MHERGTQLSWGYAGSTHYASFGNGPIVALLYFDAGDVGFIDANGETVVTPPAWTLVMVDDPDNHFAINAQPVHTGMAEQELIAATELAMEEAAREVHARLKGGDR